MIRSYGKSNFNPIRTCKVFYTSEKNDGAVIPQITLKAANNSGKSHNGTEQEPMP